MPSGRTDPFINPAGRPSNRSLRDQPSQQSLSSNSNAASTRAQQQREGLFAPALSRRPTSRTTPRVSDEILADSDEEYQEVELIAHRPRQALRPRNRHGSPETRHARVKPRQQPSDDSDLVNRDASGGFVMKGPPGHKTPELEETPEDKDAADMKAMDQYYSRLARQYFETGAHLPNRSSRRNEPDYERDVPDMVFYLKDKFMRKIEDERWRYEPVDRQQPLQ